MATRTTSSTRTTIIESMEGSRGRGCRGVASLDGRHSFGGEIGWVLRGGKLIADLADARVEQHRNIRCVELAAAFECKREVCEFRSKRIELLPHGGRWE